MGKIIIKIPNLDLCSTYSWRYADPLAVSAHCKVPRVLCKHPQFDGCGILNKMVKYY